ncbi:hypothetical protein MINTM021_11490 [Mycobacterium paraintracellulare]|nr:hypothetical protein MINTM021_11490 [Mycobacterium paraintracellulare]
MEVEPSNPVQSLRVAVLLRRWTDGLTSLTDLETTVRVQAVELSDAAKQSIRIRAAAAQDNQPSPVLVDIGVLVAEPVRAAMTMWAESERSLPERH